MYCSTKTELVYENMKYSVKYKITEQLQYQTKIATQHYKTK